MLANKDVATFPFLVGAKEYAKGISIDDVDPVKVDKYLLSVYERKIPEYIEPLDAKESVKLLVGCCAVINLIHKPRATLRFAAYEANKYTMRLKYILNKKKDFTYIDLVTKSVSNVTIKRVENTKCYAAKISDYLDLVESSNDDRLKMINQVCVSKGYVVFEYNMMFEIIRERIKSFLVEQINKMPIKKGGKLASLAHKYEYIDTFTQVYKYKPIPTQDFNIEELYERVLKLKKGKTPPCVAKIINDFGKRPSISHFERFLVASFLLSKQMSMSDIVTIFSKDIKYKQKITEDQLLQLSRREYTPPSCDKINLNGCCYYSKEICGFIKNPVQLLGD